MPKVKTFGNCTMKHALHRKKVNIKHLFPSLPKVASRPISLDQHLINKNEHRPPFRPLNINNLQENYNFDIPSSSPTNETSFTVQSSANTFSIDEFRLKLTIWSIEYAISGQAFNALLLLLNFLGIDIPTDCRALKKTPSKINYSLMPPGKLFKRNLETVVTNVLKSYPGCIPSVVKLHHSSDGLPLFLSGTMDIWPIQIYLDLPGLKPLFVQIYGGPKKPANFDHFYHSFVAEANQLFSKILNINGKSVRLVNGLFSGDAPCVSEALAIKGHTGYNCCWKCKIVGEYFKNRVVFPELDSEPRTNEEFRARRCDGIHSSMSLTALEMFHDDIIKETIIDYMHCVLLGVIKMLISLWVQKGPKGVKWSAKKISEASEMIEQLIKTMPCEFVRKFRKFEDYTRLKATELRNFLLYIGPVILDKLLPKEYYDHFLLLSLSIRILCHPSYAQDYSKNRIAHNMLRDFVRNVGTLYGKEYYTSNVHKLLHLADDALLHGPLDSYSCFKYESNLQFIKRIVKPNQFGFEQICKRVIEHENLSLIHLSKNTNYSFPVLKKKVKSEKYDLLSLEICSKEELETCEVFEEILFEDMRIRKDGKNEYFMDSDGSAYAFELAVLKRKRHLLIYCYRIDFHDSIFEYPIHSYEFGMFKGTTEKSHLVSIDCTKIDSKIMHLCFNNSHYFEPILHTT